MNDDSNKRCVWRVNLGHTLKAGVQALEAESCCCFHISNLSKEDEHWNSAAKKNPKLHWKDQELICTNQAASATMVHRTHYGTLVLVIEKF